MVVQYTVSLMTVACIIHSHSPLPVVGGTTQRCVRGRVAEAIMTVVWCNDTHSYALFVKLTLLTCHYLRNNA